MKTDIPEWKNKLYFGDNLQILREQVANESVDLIYLDPPFNSQANYNVLFGEKDGSQSQAQITAFEDTWHWTEETAQTYHDLVTEGPAKLAILVQAFHSFLGQNDMMAYLVMMAARLVELRRTLRTKGSLYLHCDPTASHYLKLILDMIFGPQNFRNEIIWKRSSAHGNVSAKYGDVTDTLLFYAKGDPPYWNKPFAPLDEEHIRTKYTYVDKNGRRFATRDLRNPALRPNLIYDYKGYKPHPNGWSVSLEKMEQYDREGRLWFPKSPSGRIRLKLYLDTSQGRPIQNLWDDIPPINSQAKERLGYPTQKPEALLERIINASSNKDDLILDPFCGCGTTINVAERLHRRWIGIDITHLAIALIKNRLHDTFATELSLYEVIGSPKDLSSAKALALQDRYQFEWWALSLIEARPAQDKKKGADSGIDGYINFFDDSSGKAKRIIVQVKSGHVTASQIRDLKAVVDRENAVIGVFITFEPPTKPMKDEALSAGYYAPEHLAKEHTVPKIQIVTIAELLNGKELKYPRMLVTTFKKAERKYKESGPKQEELL